MTARGRMRTIFTRPEGADHAVYFHDAVSADRGYEISATHAHGIESERPLAPADCASVDGPHPRGHGGIPHALRVLFERGYARRR
jgi:hypothetical protein